ncbi:hypothetical protein B0H14DRAFT_1113266 [Mycena olivaceomarginata]|nr:hypothetical protein B0H14DRAFT_1113266 [Mycena olivaceomarginata]
MDVDLAIQMTSYLRGVIVPDADDVLGEPTIHDVQGKIHLIADMFATLSCFDIDNGDIANLRPVFTTTPGSAQMNTKADRLVGCRPKPLDTQELWQSLWPSITVPRNLRDPFFKVLYTEEYKNIRSGNPRVILGIYIIMWCLQKGYLATFWPELECTGCSKYRKSHEAEEVNGDNMPEECPLDAPSATELGATDFLNKLRQEIERTVVLAGGYEERYNIPPEGKTRTAKRKRSEREDSEVEGQDENLDEGEDEGEDEDEDEGEDSETHGETEEESEIRETDDAQANYGVPYREVLANALDLAIKDLQGELQVFPELEDSDGLIRWVVNAAYMLIQV